MPSNLQFPEKLIGAPSCAHQGRRVEYLPEFFFVSVFCSMDIRAQFDWLLEERFAPNDDGRVIVAEWLVYRYGPHLEQALASCRPLDKERFDLGDTAPPDARLPLLTPDTRKALRILLTHMGFHVVGDHTYVLMRPSDAAAHLHDEAEHAAETIAAVSRQMQVLDNVANAAVSTASDYLHMMRPGQPETLAITWLTGAFLNDIEKDHTKPVLPASVARAARETAGPDLVKNKEWAAHVVTVLRRIGYRSKSVAATNATADMILEALMPPFDALGIHIIISSLRYMRAMRKHLEREPPVPAVETRNLLDVFFGNCDDVRERKAVEARQASEKAMDQIQDVTDLVDVLVHIIEDADKQESLEDRRSLHIISELNDVRRKLEDMERESHTLRDTADNLKRLLDGANTDVLTTRSRVAELERELRERPTGGSGPLPPMGGGPPPPMGGAPPPPPPPGGGPMRGGRLPTAREGDTGGGALLPKKKLKPEGPQFDMGEIMRRAEERKRRAENEATQGAQSSAKIDADVAGASNALNDAVSAARENATAKAVGLAAAKANPVLAKRIKEQRAARAASPGAPLETSDERARKQMEEATKKVLERRRRAIESPTAQEKQPKTDRNTTPEDDEWRAVVDTLGQELLYRALAAYCFVD